MPPFKKPAAIASEFASADSFRGRLVLIEVTKFEKDVPNASDPTKVQDRVTATVTTVDGGGPVQVFSQKQPTGVFLDGPEHKGVWFSQDRIVKAVAPNGAAAVGDMVLGVIQTYKPGKGAGIGNPWGLIDPTDEQVQIASDFLAGRTVAKATTQKAAPAGDQDDPFAS